MRTLWARDVLAINLVDVGIGHHHCPAQLLRPKDVVEHGTFVQGGIDAQGPAPHTGSTTRSGAADQQQQWIQMLLGGDHRKVGPSFVFPKKMLNMDVVNMFRHQQFAGLYIVSWTGGPISNTLQWFKSGLTWIWNALKPYCEGNLILHSMKKVTMLPSLKFLLYSYDMLIHFITNCISQTCFCSLPVMLHHT